MHFLENIFLLRLTLWRGTESSSFTDLAGSRLILQSKCTYLAACAFSLCPVTLSHINFPRAQEEIRVKASVEKVNIVLLSGTTVLYRVPSPPRKMSRRNVWFRVVLSFTSCCFFQGGKNDWCASTCIYTFTSTNLCRRVAAASYTGLSFGFLIF